MSPRTAYVAAVCATALSLAGLPASAAAAAPDSAPSGGRHGIQLEHLDRGLVAAATGEGVFLSWRLLGHEVSGSSATGLTGTNFNVYRDGRRIATVTDSTNYLDKAGTTDGEVPGRGRGPRRRGRAQRGDPALVRPATTTCRCASPQTASRRPARRTRTRPTT